MFSIRSFLLLWTMGHGNRNEKIKIQKSAALLFVSVGHIGVAAHHAYIKSFWNVIAFIFFVVVFAHGDHHFPYCLHYCCQTLEASVSQEPTYWLILQKLLNKNLCNLNKAFSQWIQSVLTSLMNWLGWATEKQKWNQQWSSPWHFHSNSTFKSDFQSLIKKQLHNCLKWQLNISE